MVSVCKCIVGSIIAYRKVQSISAVCFFSQKGGKFFSRVFSNINGIIAWRILRLLLGQSAGAAPYFGLLRDHKLSANGTAVKFIMQITCIEVVIATSESGFIDYMNLHSAISPLDLNLY